ncbi:MAG: hypothetical protein IE933_03480 [Sphingomonadales bacterium]|nr:hypothetical protein [Sphingomonadales bacterium]MBD3772104.1 hypothetical protein [Paracoccaceae bacterium]
MSDQTVNPDQLENITEVPPDLKAIVFSPAGPLQALPFELLLAKLIKADLVKANEADLQADVAHDEDSVAVVINDPDPLKCGWWRKIGASGAGNWAQFEQFAKSVRTAVETARDQVLGYASDASDSADEAALSAANAGTAALAAVEPVRQQANDWVRTDEHGEKALLDIDHRNARFWFNGIVYASAAALYAAMTGVTQHGTERVVTMGPVRDGNELLVGGAFADAGDVAEWTGGGGAVVTALAPGIAISGAGGYASQQITGLTVGAAYQFRVTDLTAGASYGRVSVGTTAGGSEIMGATNVANDATSTFTIYPTANTIYINLLAWATGAERRYSFAGFERNIPFHGFSHTSGTLIAEFTEQAVPGASTLLHLRNEAGAVITKNILTLASAATGDSSGSIRAADTSFQFNSATLGRVFAGRDNVLAIAWAANDVQATTNGQMAANSEVSVASIPTFDRLCVGNISGTGIMGGTMQRLTYFPRRVAALSERESWFVKHPDAIHILGDSFDTETLRQAIAAQYPARLVTRDGVGGSTLREQLDRYLRTPALWCRTLVVMDGSGDSETRTLTCLPVMIKTAGHRRIVKIEASPANALAGSPERASFDAIMAQAIEIMGPGHHVTCLAALQAANDGSPEDLQDVADNIVPRSLRLLIPGGGGAYDPIHETNVAETIRASQLKAHTDAYPWLLLPVPA